MTDPSQTRGAQGIPPSFVPSGAPRRDQSRPSARQAGSTDRPHAQELPPRFSPGSSAGTERPSRGAARSVRTSGSHPPVAGGRSAGFANRSAAAPSQPSYGSRRTATAPADPPRRNRAAVRRRHRPLRIALAAFLVLVLALGVGLVSAWRWVDGQLVRQNMLTGRADTPAQTWLVLGSDERDANDGTGITDPTKGFRTDTILVLTKPNSGNASLISIPRDSLVKVNGRSMKINAAAQAGGFPALAGAVETITGMNVDHVALIHFGGLQKVVDALGGVELCYDRTVDDVKSQLRWEAGCHLADGATALAFSRMRYSDPKGDFGRAERQRQVIGAITKKAASGETLTNPGKVRTLLETGLASLTVDEHAGTASLIQMALAFRDASGANGVTGSVYWTNPDYHAAGVGSSVLLDEKRNADLFTQLANGTHAPGTVGGQ